MFDPERAALFHTRNGNPDEAIWLIFLSIHFGKHGRHGWRMLRDVYSGLGAARWSWDRVSAQPGVFRKWLKEIVLILEVRSEIIESMNSGRRFQK